MILLGKLVALGASLLFSGGVLLYFTGSGSFSRKGLSPKAHFEFQVSNLEVELNMFRERAGRFPTEEEGLKILFEEADKTAAEGARYGLDNMMTVDLWGNEYRYELEGDSGKIISAGEDGEFETEDDLEFRFGEDIPENGREV